MTLHCSGFWPPDLFLLYSSNYILIHCPSISFLRTPRWVSREKISWDILITASFLLENMVSVPILCLGGKCYHFSSSLHLPSGISLWHLHHYIRPTENRHRETLKDTGTPLLLYSLMPQWTECPPDPWGHTVGWGNGCACHSQWSPSSILVSPSLCISSFTSCKEHCHPNPVKWQPPLKPRFIATKINRGNFQLHESTIKFRIPKCIRIKNLPWSNVMSCPP